jgi:hypothetical protein
MLKTISSQYLDVCLGDMPSGGAEAGSRGRASDTASWAWLKVIHCTVMRCSPSSATLAARNKEWLSLTGSNSNGRRQQRCTETPQRLACRGLEQWNDKYHLESRGQVQGLSTDSGTTERESDGRGKGHPKEEAIQDRRNEILGGRRRIPISQLISPTGRRENAALVRLLWLRSGGVCCGSLFLTVQQLVSIPQIAAEVRTEERIKRNSLHQEKDPDRK